MFIIIPIIIKVELKVFIFSLLIVVKKKALAFAKASYLVL